MKIHSAEIVASAVAPDGWPAQDLPEVAVMGRSNVGKSSLLNRMVARRQLARTSSTPGKTRLLHFYEIALSGTRLRLVDLPGYGYAKVSKQERNRWRSMIEAYLGERENLRAAVLLQDVRRDPQADEIDLLAWLAERQVPTVIALTKMDKLKAKEKVKRLRAVEAALPVQADWRVQTSAKTGAGVDRLWEVVLSLL
ncbi:MAG: YihA family ribosome biogenesis GTP-binding protein [Deltaproteobacteria bacterium]|nr:YihA family ribosome biogenesis GTP-binding protein [Deltaproteobacteria bacterium]MBW2396216.1 YihA family ribosome biogenesis GTP-binding protein [Deltaproteobacteria bacterium]